MTPAGYSLHSGSHRLMTKQPTKYEFNYAKNDNNYAQTHGLVGAVSSIKGYDNEVYSSRQGYVAPSRDMPMVMTTSSVDITPLLPLAIMLDMETNMSSDMDTHMDMERCWT